MVTSIGLSNDFKVVLQNLISLDYDAAEAYQAAIDSLQNPQYKQALSDFKEDHLRHTRELSVIVQELGLQPPTGPDAKLALAKGKVVMTGIMGDSKILTAMKTNEEDTNTAYERALNHKDLKPEARDAVERGLADERRHRDWIIGAVEKEKAA